MSFLTLREKQKRSTQLEVVKTAMRLFAERGFDNVRVEMICEQAGISRATFFNYFPQKQMILAAVGASRIEAMQGLLESQITSRRKMKLAHVFSLFLEFCEENEQVAGKCRNLMLQVLLNPLNQSSYVDLRKRFTEVLAEVLAELRLRGDPTVIAGSLFSLYAGTTLEWLMDSSLKRGWLSKTMKARLELAAEGFAPGTKR
ncbi:MAG: TetR/AcrR family transcriptional regulator [Bryobacteraceae bacterium]